MVDLNEQPVSTTGVGTDAVSADERPETSEVGGEAFALDRLDIRLSTLRLPRPELIKAMSGSLKRYGQLSALLAADVGDALCLVDGFKRLEAARRLSWTTIQVQVRRLSEQASVAALFSLNRVSRGLNDLEEAKVVSYLHRKLGMTQLEIGELLDRSKSWVSRRVSLIERLDEDVQRDMQVGLISSTVARDLTKLPRGNQREVATVICRNGLTSRETAALVNRLVETPDRGGQKYLLEHPREALAAAEATVARRTAPDPRMGLVANRLRRRLLQVHDGAAALNRQLSQCRPSAWTPTERQLIAPLFAQTSGAVELVTESMCVVSAGLEVSDDDT